VTWGGGHRITDGPFKGAIAYPCTHDRPDRCDCPKSESFPTDDAESRMVEPEVEAAGIEPASRSSSNGSTSREFVVPSVETKTDFDFVRDVRGGFEHWKLDGEVNPQAAISPAASGPGDRLPASPSRYFRFKTTLAGFEVEIERAGKHANLHFRWDEDGITQHWTFEEISSALPKLEALVKAARLAQEVS
jgi:hypothetical protein